MNEALSLADLESYDPHARRRGDEWRLLCPKCGDGKPRDKEHRSFALNKQTGAYFCHRCKEKGLLKDNWTKQTFTSRKARTARAIARAFSVEPLPSRTPAQENASESESSKAQTKLERLQSKMKSWQAAFTDSPAQDYLESRGIDPATAKVFGCGYAAAWEHWEKDKAGNWQSRGTDRRVVFPVTDREGNVIAFHGRAIDKDFIDSPKISKGDKSLGLFQMPNTLESEVIAICEGPMDAMALYQSGLDAAALIGTSAGAWVTSALAFRKVFVATDNDDSGNEAAATLIDDFCSLGARAVRLCPEDCNDWGEFLEKHGIDALRGLLEQVAADNFNLQKTRIETEDFVIEDVFSAGNKSGQRVIDYLFSAAAKYGDGFLLTTPTIYACETERALVEGVSKHSKGKLTDAALKTLTEQFVEAHLRANSVSLPWTSDDVPLFHITLKANGKWLENETCNQIQSWVLREFWLRQNSKAEFCVMDL
ncbi:MAG: toprim domain-containing protein [Pyrinomonadaceae bacterium]